MHSKIGAICTKYAWYLISLLFLFVTVTAFHQGAVYGQRRGDEIHRKYLQDQDKQVKKTESRQIQVVEKTEIKYRDRIRTIYIKGAEVEKSVPIYVTATDNDNFAVNAGFVRVYDAGWRNEPPGPAIDADREPAGIPLATIAEVQASNTAACLAWREQALGLREFYEQLRVVSQKEGQ